MGNAGSVPPLRRTHVLTMGFYSGALCRFTATLPVFGRIRQSCHEDSRRFDRESVVTEESFQPIPAYIQWFRMSRWRCSSPAGRLGTAFRSRDIYPVTDGGLLPLMHGGLSMSEVPTSELWRRYKQRHSQEARAQIIQRYAHLVSITAGRLFGPLPSGVERDDLVGAGVVGLVKAVDQFDPSRGIKFETYAITLIRGAILEMLRGDDWVPRLVRDQQKQLKQAYMRLEAQLGRPATEEEVAKELGISTEKLDKLLTNIGRASLLSLDDLRIGSDQQRLADILPSDSPSPLDSLALRERRRALAAAVNRLPDRERTVVALYY